MKFLPALELVFVFIALINPNSVNYSKNVFPKYNLGNYKYNGIWVDIQDDIYLGNLTKERVDEYDSNGNYKKSFACQTDGFFDFYISSLWSSSSDNCSICFSKKREHLSTGNKYLVN